MQKYKIMGKKGEGTFSEVLKAQETGTQRMVAIKCMKKPFKTKEQVNRLREIQAVRRLQPHANIVELIEVLFDRSTGRLALVFELMDMNLYELIKGRKQYLCEDKIMNYMYQLLKGLDHAHRIGLFHRDIKPENVLINSDGALKVADFGSCKGIYSKQPLTEYISTRWYRSPECLLTDGYYTYKMDLWSAGCVFFEITALFPLFPGTNELDQLHKIHNVLGTPSPEVLAKLMRNGTHLNVDFPPKQGTGLAKLVPNASAAALDLMQRLLTYDEDARCTAKEALRHPYFKKLRDAEKRQRRLRQLGEVDASEPGSGAEGKLDSTDRSSGRVRSLDPFLKHHKLPQIDTLSPVKCGTPGSRVHPTGAVNGVLHSHESNANSAANRDRELKSHTSLPRIL